MPFPLVVGAPTIIQGVTLLVGGYAVADSVATQSRSRGFSDGYSTPSLEGFNTPSIPNLAAPPPDNPVWDGRTTGTGGLEDRLAGSRNRALRDSYMPLVGAAPTSPPISAPTGAKSSSVPTPRGNEILRGKLAGQLGSAADLFSRSSAFPAGAIAASGSPFPNPAPKPSLPWIPWLPNPQDLLDRLLGKAQDLAKAIDGARVDSFLPPNPPPFTGGQSAGIAYRVQVQGLTFYNDGTGRVYAFSQCVGIIPFHDTYGPISAVNPKVFNGGAEYNNRIINSGFEIFSRNADGSPAYRFYGCCGAPTQTLTVTLTSIQITRLDGQPDTGGNPAPLIPNQAPQIPAPYPENDFPYLPQIKVGGNAAKMLDAMQAAAPAFGMPSPPAAPLNPEAPTASPPSSPLQSPPSTQPADPQPKTPVQPTGVQANLTKPSFTARPYISGKSDPREAFEPRDIKTGLTRKEQEQQWAAANQAIQDKAKANERAAAAFDAQKIREQLNNLSDVPNPQTGISPRTAATNEYLNSIKNNPISVEAFNLTSPTTTKPTNTTTTTPITTTTPTATNNNIGQILGATALLTGLVTALKIGSDALVNASLANTPKIDQIASNTTPTAQQTNAKQGVCDAMQPDQCGYQGVKQATTDATNPIKDGVAANAGLLANILAAIANLASTIATLFSNVVGKLDGIRQFLERVWSNQAVDKVMQYITMITVIHNAAMLTRSIADTLGSAFDQGLQIFGLQLKDKDGNQIGVSQLLGTSFANFVKGIIGTDNYTALTNTWIQANRIYQTGINLLSNVQNIIDSSTAVAELTNNRVATLMNALRSAGSVRENAYTAQSENVTKFNAFMNKLENLEQGVSNVAAIAGNVVSVQQSVNELKSNRQEFENALKDKPVGTGLPENTPQKEAATQKKEQSVYTIGDFSVVRPPETP